MTRPLIHVTPMSRLDAVLHATGASHLITLLTAGADFEKPAAIDADRHLHLTMNDINEPREGMITPDTLHVQTLLAYAEKWDRQGPLVINCFAGISRSTAAAYVVQCALLPDRDEVELALNLRHRSPSATPNARIVALADDVLLRHGRMRRAIASIGRGADAFEGDPFVLDV